MASPILSLKSAAIFASHEALSSSTTNGRCQRPADHPKSDEQRLYDLSAHFLWIGERTRQLDGAHIAFAELIANPIGVEITTTPNRPPSTSRSRTRTTPGAFTRRPGWATARCAKCCHPLSPQSRPLATRVIWQCDPMHGNTHESSTGYKTRHFDRDRRRGAGLFEVHRALGSHPGGVHVELTERTSLNVWRCPDISDVDLAGRYETACDLRRTPAVAGVGLLVAEFAVDAELRHTMPARGRISRTGGSRRTSREQPAPAAARMTKNNHNGDSTWSHRRSSATKGLGVDVIDPVSSARYRRPTVQQREACGPAFGGCPAPTGSRRDHPPARPARRQANAAPSAASGCGQ